MKELIEILCWFISLSKGFLEILGINPSIIDEVTSKLMDMA